MPDFVSEGIVDLRSSMDGGNKMRSVRYAENSSTIFVFHFSGSDQHLNYSILMLRDVHKIEISDSVMNIS